MTAIKLDDVSIRAGKEVIIDHIDLDLQRSSCTALLGASGSGKTSLLRTIAGFLRPHQGRVWLFGENVSETPPEKREISMLFQDPVLFPSLTVRENAELAMGRRKDGLSATCVESLGRDFQISDKLNRRVDSGLSGGERQRAALVRVFANTRDILLLDEPLRGALNVSLKWQLLRSIRNRIGNGSTTTIVVTHDFVEAAYLADNLVVLFDGSFAYGTPSDLYNRPPNLEVGLVLGPGNVMKAEFLRSIVDRDGRFPLTITGGVPITHGEMDVLFFRPEKVVLQPVNTGGFTVEADIFLGDVRRLRLRAPNDAEIEAHVPASAPQAKHVTVSIRNDDIVVFDSCCRRRDV